MMGIQEFLVLFLQHLCKSVIILETKQKLFLLCSTFPVAVSSQLLHPLTCYIGLYVCLPQALSFRIGTVSL